MLYIKKDCPLKFVAFDEPLPDMLYPDMGDSYEDYLDNRWVPLSEDQTAFHEQFPEASVKEVWDLKLNEPKVYERTLEDAKAVRIIELVNYDTSVNVNSFTINGDVTAWFKPEERRQYKQSIESAKLLGVDKLSFYVGDTKFDVETLRAEQMLATLQLYADACFMTTKGHKIAIENLGSIEEVDAYDFTTGYPQKLNFEL